MEPTSDAGPGSVDVALVQLLAEAVQGNGRLALLLGEAGIGKTTAARSIAASARRSGVTVRWSACSASGKTVHGPWLTLFAGLGAPGERAAAALLDSGLDDRAAATAARSARYLTVVDALEEATRQRPLLLVLDDLHWADSASLLLLDTVAAHAPAMAMLIVGTYRDTDAPHDSPLTRIGGRADRFSLHGLDQGGVERLLSSHLGPRLASAVAAKALALTGGNPFLVAQIGRLIPELPHGFDVAALPTGARDLLEQRLGALDADDRSVLTAAAVLGNRFRTSDLAQTIRRRPLEVDASLERIAAQRLVQRAAGTGTWSFVHDLFAVAARRVTPADLVELHGRAAEVLESAGAEAGLIAMHLHAAGESRAADAARWSVLAGDRAIEAMSWEDAAGHYERALEARVGCPDDVRADALAGLGRAGLLAGDHARAEAAFDDLADLGRALGSPELLGRAALGFSADLSGFEVTLFDQRQIDLLEEAARALAPASSPGLLATVLARLSVALSLTAPDARRLELVETAVSLARTAGDPVILGRALAAHCDAIAGPAHVDQRLVEATEVIAIAEVAGDGSLELLGRRLRLVARLERGDRAGVDEDIAAFGRRAAALGNPLYSWYVPLWKAQFAAIEGDLDRAERLIEEAEHIGSATASMNAPMLALVSRLVLLWQRGQADAARAAFESIVEVAPDLALHLSSTGARAVVNLLAGRIGEANAALDRAQAISLRDQVADAEWLPNMCSLVRAAAALDHPLLAEVVEVLEPFGHLVSFEGIGAGLYGSVSRYVALGCSALGRHDDALRYARDAVAVNQRFGGSIAADARRTLGECLHAAGHAEEAEAAHLAADGAYRLLHLDHFARVESRPGDRDREVRPSAVAVRTADGSNRLRRVGDVWHVDYLGVSTIIAHSKGLGDLSILLGRPNRDVHVTELDGVPAGLVDGRGDDALDRRAITAYKHRLGELAAEIDDADAAHDLARAERARVEYELLVDQLTGAVGLGGRLRPAGPDPVERLRKAVSARVRDAIRHIEVLHPPLGRHLANAIHTGRYCSYRPETPTEWA